MKSVDTSTKLADIAEELGISVSTVSRALSGKGRISEETVNKVRTYMNEHEYRPNMLAKGLANGKSYSICSVLPSDAVTGQIPFFYECLMGICSAGMKKNYTTTIVTEEEGKLGRLESVVSMGKADGYILLRAKDDDQVLKYLMDRNCKIVVVGDPGIKGVEFVDENHEGVCEAFTDEIISQGFKSPSAIVGALEYHVNRSRKSGYLAAVAKNGLKSTVYTATNDAETEEAVALALETGSDCIFCGDDTICLKVLSVLKGNKRPAVTSFYYSDPLAAAGIKAPKFNAKDLGSRAANILINNIE